MKMPLRRAASIDERRLYCLLSDEERQAYQCVETAEALGAIVEDERLRAYWHHFTSHIEAYGRWARRKNLFDPTIDYLDIRERADNLVKSVLISFQRIIREGRFNPAKGLPCQYIKRSIKNRFQDILRRGRHPTPEECARCWREGGECRFSGRRPPGAEERQRCLRLPATDSLDLAEVAFALAGLQDTWPPESWYESDGARPRRPVETQALKEVVTEAIWDLIDEELTQDQREVLRKTILHGRSGQEIAEELSTSRSNVYQLKRRGIQRLIKILEVVRGS